MSTQNICFAGKIRFQLKKKSPFSGVITLHTFCAIFDMEDKFCDFLFA